MITPGAENPFEWQGLGEKPKTQNPTNTGNNYFDNGTAFGESRLPGQGTGTSGNPVQNTFDPNRLPGEQPANTFRSGDAYTDPNGDPFNQPTLGGTIGSRNGPKGTGSVTKPPTPDYPLAGPGYQEDLYKDHGKDLIDTPSASEDLYSRGVTASNPYYDFAQKEAIKAINDSSAARGNFNSSYAQNLIGKTVADIRGQQAHELGMLAGQADEGKRGRYDSSFKYAGDAQDRFEGRANKSLDYQEKLSRGQSELVNNFYKTAGEQGFKAAMAEIEATLKKAGLTAAEAQLMMDQFMAGVETVGTIYGAGGMGGGGGGGSAGSGGGGAGPTLYV